MLTCTNMIKADSLGHESVRKQYYLELLALISDSPISARSKVLWECRCLAEGFYKKEGSVMRDQ